MVKMLRERRYKPCAICPEFLPEVPAGSTSQRDDCRRCNRNNRNHIRLFEVVIYPCFYETREIIPVAIAK